MRKRICWTNPQKTKLRQLYCDGKSLAEIAAELGITTDRVRVRLKSESRANCLDAPRKKRLEAAREARNRELQSPRAFIEPVIAGPHPTEEALRLRAIRINAMPRDLTGAFFGDPPLGFSALELRA